MKERPFHRPIRVELASRGPVTAGSCANASAAPGQRVVMVFVVKMEKREKRRVARREPTALNWRTEIAHDRAARLRLERFV